MRRPNGSDFTPYRRSNSPFYYCELKNPKIGEYLPAKSTRETDYSPALLVPSGWIKIGLPDSSGDLYPSPAPMTWRAYWRASKQQASPPAMPGRSTRAETSWTHQSIPEENVIESSPLFVPWRIAGGTTSRPLDSRG